MREELFEIILDNEGRGHILRLFNKVKIIFILSFIWIGVGGCATVFTILSSIKAFKMAGMDLTPRIIVNYLEACLLLVLFPIQVYYYYTFTRRIREAIHEKNSIKFNQSFRLLNTNAILWLVSIVLSIGFASFQAFSVFVD